MLKVSLCFLVLAYTPALCSYPYCHAFLASGMTDHVQRWWTSTTSVNVATPTTTLHPAPLAQHHATPVPHGNKGSTRICTCVMAPTSLSTLSIHDTTDTSGHFTVVFAPSRMICVHARISEVLLTCPSLWGSSGSHPVLLLGKSGVFEPFFELYDHF